MADALAILVTAVFTVREMGRLSKLQAQHNQRTADRNASWAQVARNVEDVAAHKQLLADERRADQIRASVAADKPLAERDEFVRAANEDDDGYDPYSDRPADREPVFEEDPWR